MIEFVCLSYVVCAVELYKIESNIDFPFDSLWVDSSKQQRKKEKKKKKRLDRKRGGERKPHSSPPPHSLVHCSVFFSFSFFFRLSIEQQQ